MLWREIINITESNHSFLLSYFNLFLLLLFKVMLSSFLLSVTTRIRDKEGNFQQDLNLCPLFLGTDLIDQLFAH